MPYDRYLAAELTVWTCLTRGDVQAARDVLENVDLPEPLATLLEGLANAVSGEPVGPVTGDTEVRRALAMKLGGPTVPLRTVRGQAIVDGTSTGYPESALVALLESRLAGS